MLVLAVVARRLEVSLASLEKILHPADLSSSPSDSNKPSVVSPCSMRTLIGHPGRATRGVSHRMYMQQLMTRASAACPASIMER